MKRPEGMSREAFALLGDSHPIISTQLVPKKQELKAKPKPSTKGFVTWTYKPIMTSARTDDLKLLHWVKGYKDAAGRMKEDEETDSYFAKFNKKVQLMKYNDEEYNNLIRPGDKDWTREETDYLLDMCERFDLRFIVIADRYEFTPPPGAPQRAPPPARSVDDLKERYYYIAQRLLEAREAGKAAVSNHILVRHPFDKNHELERKKAIELLLKRTKQQTEEDNAILAEARLIEERLKAEAKPKQTAGAAGAGGAANNAMSNAAAAAAALAMGEITFPESFSNDPGPGQPSLFNAALEPTKPPKPGVYGRAMHALNLSNSLVASMPGGVKAQKALEAVLSDSSWGPAASAPRCGTRAVCGAWLALRLELMALQELRRVALPSRGPAAGADAGARQKRKK